MNDTEIQAWLERHGVLPTSQRMAIGRVLFSNAQHLSADQVMARMCQRGAAVSKATVYNTLGLFASKGLIREVIVDPARVVYDSNTEPHHHFYNVDTGELIDFDGASVPLGELPVAPPGTEVCGVDVIVRVQGRPGAGR